MITVTILRNFLKKSKTNNRSLLRRLPTKKTPPLHSVSPQSCVRPGPEQRKILTPIKKHSPSSLCPYLYWTAYLWSSPVNTACTSAPLRHSPGLLWEGGCPRQTYQQKSAIIFRIKKLQATKLVFSRTMANLNVVKGKHWECYLYIT